MVHDIENSVLACQKHVVSSLYKKNKNMLTFDLLSQVCDSRPLFYCLFYKMFHDKAQFKRVYAK